jgi:hypothetical protein
VGRARHLRVEPRRHGGHREKVTVDLQQIDVLSSLHRQPVSHVPPVARLTQPWLAVQAGYVF